MRTLLGCAHALFALALTLQGCWQTAPRSPDSLVGKPAPEIDGQDLDGVAFRLSDYRGQVVVLDFWGDW